MKTSVLERSALDEDFVYTEFCVDWREPLPLAKFGNKRFLWGCVALAVGLMVWMSQGR